MAKNSLTEMSRCDLAIDSAVARRRRFAGSAEPLDESGEAVNLASSVVAPPLSGLALRALTFFFFGTFSFGRGPLREVVLVDRETCFLFLFTLANSGTPWILAIAAKVVNNRNNRLMMLGVLGTPQALRESSACGGFGVPASDSVLK